MFSFCSHGGANPRRSLEARLALAGAMLLARAWSEIRPRPQAGSMRNRGRARHEEAGVDGRRAFSVGSARKPFEVSTLRFAAGHGRVRNSQSAAGGSAIKGFHGATTSRVFARR